MKLVIHGINRVAMVLFNILIGISLIGAIALIPGDFASSLRLGLIIVIVAGIVAWGLVSLERRSPGVIMNWAHDHNRLLWITGGVIAVLTVAWQLMMVRALSGWSGWDPYSIMQAAVYPQSKWRNVDPWYFSYYPNNILLTELYHQFAIAFRLGNLRQLTIGANYLNVLIIDLAGLFLNGATKEICKVRSARIIVIALYWGLVMMWPYIVIPYSDTWAILIGSILIFSYVHVIKPEQRNYNRYLWVAIFGAVLAFGYFIKPSTIIFAIGIMLVQLLSELRGNKWAKVAPLIVVCLFGVIAVSLPVEYAQSHTRLVRVDPQKRFPISQPIAMGMVGEGSYDYNQVVANKAIKNFKARNHYDWQLVKSEAINYVHHPISYVRFLFKKQIANTSEGTFGWAREGHFLENPYNRNNLNSVEQWQQRHLFNRDRVATTDLAGLNILAQLGWVITLGSLLIRGIELDPRDRTVQILKYTILGGMLFLLIFEGGRSRYMMQFLPYAIMVAAINIAGWYNHRLRKINNQEGVS